MIVAIINTIIDTDIEIIVDEIISAGKGLALHAGDAALAKKKKTFTWKIKRGKWNDIENEKRAFENGNQKCDNDNQWWTITTKHCCDK